MYIKCVAIFNYVVLTVQFEMPYYSYSENDGQGSVNITLSQDVAEDFTVSIIGSMYK